MDKQNKINVTNKIIYKFFPKNKNELKKIIKNQIKKYGDTVDLNNIDTSQISNMSYLFKNSKFNGNISKWNVSNVIDMSYMFSNSIFDKDISK